MTRSRRLLARVLGPVVLLTGTTLWMPASGAQQPPGPGAGSPATLAFDASAFAAPVMVEINAPTALPIDIQLGLFGSEVTATDAPFVQAEAAPLYAPLVGALAALGGLGVLLDLAPGALLGLPATIGLPPLPLDPGLLPPFPPALYAILNQFTPLAQSGSCFAYFPAQPHEASSVGPSQEFAGYEGRVFNGQARAVPPTEEGAAMGGEASVQGVGTAALPGAVPQISFGAVTSSAAVIPTAARVETRASTTVNDIDIAGLIHIGSITNTVTAAADGTEGGASVDAPACRIGDISVLGVPARLEGTELVVAEDAFALPGTDSILAVLGRALEAAGITIDFFPASTEQRPTNVRAQTGCMAVTLRYAPSNSRATITFARASTQLSAASTAFTAGPGLPLEPTSGSAPDLGAPTSSAVTGSVAPTGPSTTAIDDSPESALAPIPTSPTADRRPCGFECVYRPYMLLALSSPFLVRLRRATLHRRLS